MSEMNLLNRVKELEARVTELELAVMDGEIEVDLQAEMDPLEAAHQAFVQSIKARREGNA